GRFGGAEGRLDHPEGGLETLRSVEVRHVVPQLAVDLGEDRAAEAVAAGGQVDEQQLGIAPVGAQLGGESPADIGDRREGRSEEHTSELQSRENLVCRLLLEKKNEYRFYKLL